MSFTEVPEILNTLINSSTKGIRQIINDLSDILKFPGFITDSRCRMITDGYHSETDEIITIDNISKGKTHQIFTCHLTTLSFDTKVIGCPILYMNKLLGYIFVVGKSTLANEPYFQSLLITSSTLCALQLNQENQLLKEMRKFKEAFLFNLLYGNLNNKREIIEYGFLWGWDFNLPHSVIVFSTSESNNPAIDRVLQEDLRMHTELTVEMANIIPITLQRQNLIVAIIPISGRTSKGVSPISTICEDVIRKMSNLYPDKVFICGVGKPYQDASDLFLSFQEAKVALELGDLLNIEIASFQELGLERILYKHDQEDLKEFYETTLGKLEKLDKMSGTQYLDTLENLSTNNFDLIATSNKMVIHRNTLKYRVKKIEEILDIKLDEFNNRLNIIAVKIKQLRKLG
jgi:PucR family transcriptional regulator, purine catabolism regulatory protein